MADDAMSDYPVTFDVAYPEFPNRWLILVRWLLAFPHYVVLYFLGLIAGLVWVISFFTILFARTYPESLYRFMVGVTRWSLNVNAYVLFLDRYPPFSMDATDYEAVTFTVEKPDFNRWLVLVKWLLVIPHLIVVTVLGVIALVAALLLALGVLVMGRYPRGLFDFLVGVGRWETRANAYMMFLVDAYPPFSLREQGGGRVPQDRCMAMFDTLRASRRLQEAGFEEAQADALVGVFHDDVSENVATKSDIAHLEERLTARIDALEQRMIIRLGGLIALATGPVIAAIAITD